jgi:transglutaminase-like putative cysteine protease
VETKLNKDAVFTEKESKKYVRKKFTLPGIKEGSIIEYEYRITSDFLFSLQPWSFQGASPCLWSEFRLSVPQFLNYVFLSNGNHPFYIRDKKDRIDNFDVREANTAQATESYRFSSGVTEYRWAMKDVPEIKEERFTSSVANHVSKIEFQLSGYREPLTFKNILGTWSDVTQELLKDEDFGSALDKTNGWIGDITKPLLAGTASEEEKARKIFMYVRDNITCTAYNGIYAYQSLKNILKNKNGTVSEINLLLTAMLRYADIQAEPVLLSTKEHGLVYPIYPIVSRFNYVVTQATIGGLPYMLDASHARLGFGKLLPDCYNGHARIVNAAATPMDLFPDSLSERKITSVFMSHTAKEKWVGTIQQTPGYYESYQIRDKVKEKGEDDFFKEVKKGYGMDLDIEETGIDSLNKYELPVKVHYTVRLKGEDEDIMYMNPMFGDSRVPSGQRRLPRRLRPDPPPRPPAGRARTLPGERQEGRHPLLPGRRARHHRRAREEPGDDAVHRGS